MSQYSKEAKQAVDAGFDWLINDQLTAGAYFNAFIKEANTLSLEWFRDKAAEFVHKTNIELSNRWLEAEGSEVRRIAREGSEQ